MIATGGALPYVLPRTTWSWSLERSAGSGPTTTVVFFTKPTTTLSLGRARSIGAWQFTFASIPLSGGAWVKPRTTHRRERPDATWCAQACAWACAFLASAPPPSCFTHNIAHIAPRSSPLAFFVHGPNVQPPAPSPRARPLAARCHCVELIPERGSSSPSRRPALQEGRKEGIVCRCCPACAACSPPRLACTQPPQPPKSPPPAATKGAGGGLSAKALQARVRGWWC